MKSLCAHCAATCSFRTTWEKRREGAASKRGGRTEYNRRCNTRTEFPTWPNRLPGELYGRGVGVKR